jgi:hypothetical protein
MGRTKWNVILIPSLKPHYTAYCIIQLNCHKSRAVHTSLEADTPKTGLFIYFLQETYSYEQNPCGLTKLFLHFLPDVKCCAAIYALPALGLVFHPNLSSRDCATASVTIEGERVYFSAVYLDICLAVAEPAWILTMQKASSTCCHCMAGVDSNCHSDVWGSSDTNVRGLLLEEVLFKHRLCVLNKGSDYL